MINLLLMMNLMNSFSRVLIIIQVNSPHHALILKWAPNLNQINFEHLYSEMRESDYFYNVNFL